MNPRSTSLLRNLLFEHSVAALGTVRDGAPLVSMTPFATQASGRELYVHVSGLAAHQRNMLAEPRVSMLITEHAQDHPDVLSLGRVSILGRARAITQDEASYALARETYLSRLPQASELFSFPDFQLMAITINEARLVAGFAQAHTLSAEDVMRVLTESAK